MQAGSCLQPFTDMPLAGTLWNCAQQPVVSYGGIVRWNLVMALPAGRLACSSVQQHRPAQPRQHTVHARRGPFLRPATHRLPVCTAGTATGARAGCCSSSSRADSSRDSSVWATRSSWHLLLLHASLERMDALSTQGRILYAIL
jgi:hypothetical protein